MLTNIIFIKMPKFAQLFTRNPHTYNNTSLSKAISWQST